MSINPGGPWQTLRSDARLWAYLSDPMPTGGSAELFEQKRIIDAIATWTGRSIDRYVVDSGSVITADGYGTRLAALLGEAHDPDHDTIIVVSDLAHLAATKDGRERALAALLSGGFVIKDRTGSLKPSSNTVALAEAAVRHTGRRKRPTDRSLDNA